MSAATASQLTEAEIRAEIDRTLDPIAADIGSLIYDYQGPINYVAPDQGEPASLWRNLRPSEAQRLDELQGAMYRELEPVIDALIRDAVVKAALTFAAEYPDAPRA